MLYNKVDSNKLKMHMLNSREIIKKVKQKGIVNNSIEEIKKY